MTTTVYQLLMDMVKHEQNFGAYWIYLALTKGYLQKHDPIDKIYDVPFTQSDIEKIHEMDAQDVLGINRIKLYATQLCEKKYAFYFAESPVDAQTLHENHFGEHAVKWHSVYKQYSYQQVTLVDKDETLYWWELKAQFVEFPALVGVMTVGGKTAENASTGGV